MAESLEQSASWSVFKLGIPFAFSAGALGAVLGLVSLFSTSPDWQVGLLVIGCALVLLGAAVYIFSNFHRNPRVPRIARPLIPLLKHDHTPHFITDRKGNVRYQNLASVEKLGPIAGRPLYKILGDLAANPEAVVYRLQARAQTTGAAQEDVQNRRKKLRLALQALGKDYFVWRFEGATRHESEKTDALTQIPKLSLAPDGSIREYNHALGQLFSEDQPTLADQTKGMELASGSYIQLETVSGAQRYLIARNNGSTGGADVMFFAINQDQMNATPTSHIGVNGLPVPLMLIDAEGVILDVNKRAEKLMDRRPDDRTFMSDVFEGLGRSVVDWLKDVQSGRGAARPEVLKVKHPTKEIYLQVSLARMDSGFNGHDGALLAVLNDATELKTLEAQFVQSQKMQAIGQLAGGVAHDFNNLLTAISGHCDLLLLRHDQSDQDYADLVQIHQNANRAASLVGQLLAFSRKQNLQPEVLDLRDTLSDLTHLLNRLVGEKVSLKLTHEPQVASVRADKRQLEQVLMNLVVNARDAMPDGGEITISTVAVSLAEEMVRHRAVVPAGDYIVVDVSDQGVGIAPDKVSKIFEPFYTTKRTGEGTGLGLSTAYGIVKQTGGYIFADSELGKGTTFSLYFPAHKASIETEITQTQIIEKPIAKPGEGVVLLVEDEAPVRAFASRALRMRGYKVLEAENAEQALETLKDASLEIDVFVTDVIMPGLDGPTWVREALKTRPDTKVIFVSGYAEESLTDQQSRIPNSVFLPKPFSLNELANTVLQQTH